MVVASHQTVSLFAAGRAPSVFEAVLARTGPHPTVTYVAVTPGELLVETPSEDRESSRRIDWRASIEIPLAGIAAIRLLSAAGAGGVAVTAWALRRAGLPRQES